MGDAAGKGLGDGAGPENAPADFSWSDVRIHWIHCSLEECSGSRCPKAAAHARFAIEGMLFSAATAAPSLVEEEATGRLDRHRHLVAVASMPRFLALDDQFLAAAGIGIDVAGRSQMLGHVDLDGDVAVALAGVAEMLGPHADARPRCPTAGGGPESGLRQRGAALVDELDGDRCIAIARRRPVPPKNSSSASRRSRRRTGWRDRHRGRAARRSARYCRREHDDPVGQRHRLGLVVRDIDHGDAELLVQARDLDPHLHPQLGVEIATAARRTGTPAARARWRGRWRRAGAGRRTAAAAGAPSARRCAGSRRRASPAARCRPCRCRSSCRPKLRFCSTVICG